MSATVARTAQSYRRSVAATVGAQYCRRSVGVYILYTMWEHSALRLSLLTTTTTTTTATTATRHLHHYFMHGYCLQCHLLSNSSMGAHECVLACCTCRFTLIHDCVSVRCLVYSCYQCEILRTK